MGYDVLDVAAILGLMVAIGLTVVITVEIDVLTPAGVVSIGFALDSDFAFSPPKTVARVTPINMIINTTANPASIQNLLLRSPHIVDAAVFPSSLTSVNSSNLCSGLRARLCSMVVTHGGEVSWYTSRLKSGTTCIPSWYFCQV